MATGVLPFDFVVIVRVVVLALDLGDGTTGLGRFGDSFSICLLMTRSRRLYLPSSKPLPMCRASYGHASTHSPQNMHLPMSMSNTSIEYQSPSGTCSPLGCVTIRMIPSGQYLAQLAQPVQRCSYQLNSSPRKRACCGILSGMLIMPATSALMAVPRLFQRERNRGLVFAHSRQFDQADLAVRVLVQREHAARHHHDSSS